MTRLDPTRLITLSRLLVLTYFIAWIHLLVKYVGELSLAEGMEVFMNALIIALFVGLGLNVKAFQVRAVDGSHRPLKRRFIHIPEHLPPVLASSSSPSAYPAPPAS